MINSVALERAEIAAQQRPALEYRDGEVALSEAQSRAQTGDPSADDSHLEAWICIWHGGLD